MHELSIAQSILEIVKDEARKHGLGHISKIRLKIGKLTAIEPSSVSFCFDLISKDSPAEGASLEIESVPITGRCNDCTAEFTLDLPFGSCPDCESLNVTIVAGREFYIAEIEADD